MRNGIHLKGASDLLFCLVEDIRAIADTRIVDQDGRLAVVLADLAPKLGQLLRGRDIGLVEMHRRRWGPQLAMPDRPRRGTRGTHSAAGPGAPPGPR